MTSETVKPTGRDWGDKRPFRVISKTPDSITYEFDAWDGPTTAGEDGQYLRHRVTAKREAAAASVGNVTWRGELLRALG